MPETKQYREGTYSTGELAKQCGVSVRTVQYYDQRGLLAPSELTEGGRRLYTEADARKLKLLCYLRSLGLSIDSIGRLLKEENANKVIDTLLEEQARSLVKEASEAREKLREVRAFQNELRGAGELSEEKMQDIAYAMKTKNELKKTRAVMLAVGAPLSLGEIGTLIYAVRTGRWLPFAVWMALAAAACIFLVVWYFKRVDYVCPECHASFHPGFGSFMFSMHTPKTRKLTCPSCGKKSYCIEIARETDER